MSIENMTREQKKKIIEAIRSKKTEFIFIPSRSLKDKIMQNEDTFIVSLPSGMPEILLGCPDGKGISLAPDLVVKMINGNLDAKNKYILSMGNVIVKGM